LLIAGPGRTLKGQGREDHPVLLADDYALVRAGIRSLLRKRPKMVRVWARHSDRMRSNPIIARNQGETLDRFGAGDTGASAQCPTGATFCIGLTLNATVEAPLRRQGAF
jgi:hypothetical protein